MTARGGGKVLLVTNNFPPVRGGSAMVYESLARYAGGQVVPVVPWRNYLDGSPLAGWREHDRRAPYRVRRLALLRTVMGDAAAASLRRRLGLLLCDRAIRLRLLAVLLGQVLGGGVAAICVGELVTSGWLIRLLRFLPGLRVIVPGLRVIVYVHGEEITTRYPFDPDGRARRRTLLAADRIVVVSHFAEASVRRLLGPQASARAPITLIQNGVDTARFTPREKRRDLLVRYRLDGSFVFVSVCRLVEKKGIDHALLAFAGVLRAHPDCRYLVVGTGPDRDRLHRIAADAAVADKVVFAGAVAADALADHYCLGDVFVMPNRRLADGDTEGFGLVFLEANSCGLPVIAGRDGGSTDAVCDGVNGLVVDGTSVAAIAAAMRRLREDAALRAALSRGGLARAQAAGWAAKTRTFLRLCRGTAAEAGRET